VGFDRGLPAVLDDERVDGRECFEGAGAGFDEERHEAESDAVLVFELFLVALAEVHDGGHIALIEGGEHGRGLLGLDEPGRDALSELAHPLTLHTTPPSTPTNDWRGCSGGLRRGRCI